MFEVKSPTDMAVVTAAASFLSGRFVHHNIGLVRGGGCRAEIDLHLASRFPRLPSVDNLKQTVPRREVRRLSRDWIPRNISRAAHRSERWTDQVPACMFGDPFRNSDTRQTGRIQWDHA